jgi:endonuclease/exonuclease/phosphatase family metal-dependent hydrolase
VFVVTHLHHVPADDGTRAEQAARLLEWLQGTPANDAMVLVGDFNATPDSEAVRRLCDAGFRSAYELANGADPAVTWPSGLQAPAMDTDGEPSCLDYVWVRGKVAVEEARLFADRPAVGDPTLFPSDHLGIAARLRFG